MQVGLYLMLIVSTHSQTDSPMPIQDAKFAASLFQNAQFLSNSQYGWLKQVTNSENYNGSVEIFRKNAPTIIDTVFNTTKPKEKIENEETQINSTVICVITEIKQKNAVKCVRESEKDILLLQMNSTLQMYKSYTINNPREDNSRTKFEVYRFNISDDSIKIDFSDFKSLLAESTGQLDIVESFKKHLELQNNLSTQLNDEDIDSKTHKESSDNNLAQAEVVNSSHEKISIRIHSFPDKPQARNSHESKIFPLFIKISIPICAAFGFLIYTANRIICCSVTIKSTNSFMNIKDIISGKKFLHKTLESLKCVEERGEYVPNISEYIFSSFGDIKTDRLVKISNEKSFGPVHIQQLGNLIINYWNLEQESIDFKDLILKMTSNNLDEVPSISEALAHPAFMTTSDKYNFLKSTAAWLTATEKSKRKGTLNEFECEAYKNFRIYVEKVIGQDWPEKLCQSSEMFIPDKIVSKKPQAIVNFIIKANDHYSKGGCREKSVYILEALYPRFFIQIYNWVINHYQKNQSISSILFVK